MNLIECGNCGAPLSAGEVVECEYCHYRSQSPKAPTQPDGPRLAEGVSLQVSEDFGIGLLAQGTVLPITKTDMLSTSRDDQDSLTVILRAGNATRPTDNRLLGTYLVPLQKRGPRGTVSAGLVLRVDERGALGVTVKEQGVDELSLQEDFQLATLPPDKVAT